MKKVLGFLLALTMITCQLPLIKAAAADEKEMYYQERMDFYRSFEINDPNHIEDADFFGEWDEETESWNRGPCFDYERFPELENIENAAKMGDYDLCKAEALEFYRAYLKTHSNDFGSGTTSRCNMLAAEMIMEGVNLNPTDTIPMGRITLTRETQKYEIDIYEALKTDMAKQANTMSVGVQDVKKDGYRGTFYSIGSGEHEPYIVLIVNGAQRTYRPVADKTLYPDTRVNEQHTGEGFIYANESYTSINPDKNCIPPESLVGKTKSDFENYKWVTAFKPIDKYTARGYLRFDFSDIGATDKVSGGKLYIWGYMEEDDNPVRPEETKDEIDVFVMDDRVKIWIEDSSWASSGPDAVFSYVEEFGPTISKPVVETSGQWDNTITNPTTEPKLLAQLYVGTGNEVYAYHAIRLLINTVLKVGGNLPISTQEALMVPMRSTRLLTVLYPLIDSEHMTPEYFTMILKFFHVTNDYLVSGWKQDMEGANGGSLHTSSLLRVGMAFRHFKHFWGELEGLKNPSLGGSMQGGWLKVGLFRSRYKLRETVLESGAVVEVPLGYVDTNISAIFSPYYEADKAFGIGELLRGNIDEELAELFRASARYVIDLSNPIGGTWQSGDESKYTSKIGGGLAGYARFFLSEEDPVLEWAYSEGKSGNPPEEYTSFVNNDVNRLVLRSSWAQDAVALYMDSDGGWRNHGHNDDLAVNLMAYGKFMLYDPSVNRYTGQPKLVAWQRSTRAHNTIEINEITQKGFQTGGRQSGPNGEKIYYPTEMAFKKGTTAKDDIRPLSDFNEEREFLGKDFNFVFIHNKEKRNIYDLQKRKQEEIIRLSDKW